MQIAINIFITFAFMFWPIIFMMSPMMLGAPGADNDKSQVISVMLFLSYPIGISLLLWIFGGSYFGVKGFKLTIICVAVIVIGFALFGYFGTLTNLAKGIANTGYSIANNRAYYGGKRIDGADGASFVILDNDKFGHSMSWYAKDRSHFYYQGVAVDGAIPDNFKKVEINGDIYWLNSTQVIRDDIVLVGADPNHFYGFEGDRHDGWTYSIGGEQYFVYSRGKRLPDVDRDTFTPLTELVAKDKFHIYERDKIILPEADASSFELLEDHSFGKDKNQIYYLNHLQPFAIKDIDRESFEILDESYIRDKNHVYFIHRYKSIEKLDQIDVTSFEVTPYDESTSSHARDRNHYYYDEKIAGNRN